MAVALATSLLAIGCYPEVLTPDQSQLPVASELDVRIDVDQTTNYVTFTVTNEGVVPMWIFGEDKVEDGKAAKKYAYTANGLKLRVRDAGEHQVEVKAYNANGISLGSKIVTYNLENTYRDPFNAAPYMKKLAARWQWNYENDGHFGCGPNTEAIEDMQKAAELVPNLPYAYYNLGNLYCLSSELVNSIDNYTKAIDLYPYMGDAYFNRGLVLIYLKDKEKGCIDLSRAGELGVQDAYGVIKKYCEEENVQ